MFLANSDMLTYSRDRLLSLCPPVISPSELHHRVHRGCRTDRRRRVRLTSLKIAVLSDEPRVPTVIIGNRPERRPTRHSSDVKQAFRSDYEQDVTRDSSVTGLGVLPCRGYPVVARPNSLPVSTPDGIPTQCDVISVSPFDFPTVYVQHVRPKICRAQRLVSTTDRELPVCANHNTDVLLHPHIDRHTNPKLHRLT